MGMLWKRQSKMKVVLKTIFLLIFICSFLIPALTGTALADAETISLTPTFTGSNTADNFTAGDTYNLTVNITAATLSEPILVIRIPNRIALGTYPAESNATLAPNLANIPDPVYVSTDESGNTLLFYHFKEHTASIGFNFALTPSYKLTDGQTYTVTAQLYDGETLNSSTDSGIRITNPSIKYGFLSIYMQSEDVLITGSGTDYLVDMKVENTLYNHYLYNGNYPYHYPYDSMTIAVPVPNAATPGYYDGNNDFVIMEDNDSKAITNGTITYYENYSYEDRLGTTLSGGKALVYELTGDHPFSAGNGAYYLPLNSLADMYFSFPGTTAAGIYQGSYSPQVSASIDGVDTVLFDYSAWYKL